MKNRETQSVVRGALVVLGPTTASDIGGKAQRLAHCAMDILPPENVLGSRTAVPEIFCAKCPLGCALAVLARLEGGAETVIKFNPELAKELGITEKGGGNNSAEQ